MRVDSSREIEKLSDERTLGGEVLLIPADAERAIAMLTKIGIAVLGVEVMCRHPTGLETLRISDYEIDPSTAEWSQFVLVNNDLARDFVASATTSPNERVILTTASEAELRNCSGGQTPGQ